MKYIFFIITYFLSFSLVSQSITVNGKISDENNQGLPGATIIIEGTTNGTISDIDGNFTLSADINSFIEISYAGYLSKKNKNRWKSIY